MAVKKYIKFDSEKGYLDNKDDINYFSTNQMRKVAFGKMLGDFDENGLYVINSKIVDELIRMPKVIVEIIEDTDLIRSTVKADSFFHFILTVEDNKAKFKLLEKVYYQSNRDFNSGLYSNINEYVLDEVIITDRYFDRNALYQKYNISTENNGDVLSIFDMDELSIAMYYNLIDKLKLNYLVQNALMLKEKQLEEIEANYFEGVLSVLAEFGDFGKQVTDGIKKDLAEKHTFVIVSKPFFQHAVNEVMDSYIDMFISGLSPEQRDAFNDKYRSIKERYYEQFKKIIPIEIAQKSGVRFDANQILQEGVIGSLVQEIQTKGFTSSDVRKIIINEGELQLPISKIKEIVKQNEDVVKRDNAKARDIVKGREQTSKFYKDLEKANNVNMLTPDTTLIEDKIKNQQQVKAVEQNNVNKVEAQKNTSKVEAQKNTGKVEVQKNANKAEGQKKTNSNNLTKQTVKEELATKPNKPKITQTSQRNAGGETTRIKATSSSNYSGGYSYSDGYDYPAQYNEDKKPETTPVKQPSNSKSSLRQFIDNAAKESKTPLRQFIDNATKQTETSEYTNGR